MFRDIHYAEVGGLYKVTVTCITGGYYDNNDVGGVLFFLVVLYACISVCGYAIR